ncbi:integrase [Rhodomicrobium udaipurense JA643]|uniref:Tyrosine-type recombinase/integrase n=1 Tax=Rhodomicrobium udaipurense TaxID=1202716 RepID=A0A8I1G7F4_9HYPH|nr:site-specific integrase [Rhodomicrobium udaipurense]KAI95187.1 integrase [Rhodomicrobium udaipurense JA643]MBJ7541953.1 tyrosine-type recombinase/integrase [Rhodomicrobium udaipurense]
MGDIVHAKVTKTAIDRLQPGQLIRDTELSGFGARRRAGAPVYFVQTRIAGRLRWLTIGTHGIPWTAETARKQALKLLGEIAGGGDPTAPKREAKAQITLKEASVLFMEQHGPRLKPRTREEYDRLFRLHLVPAFGKKNIIDITRPDIARFHAKRAATPSGANFALACLSKLMTWAEETGLRPENTNPCRKVKKYRAGQRERYLTLEEYARLGEVLDGLERNEEESPFVIAAVRLLALTGARLNEILTLHWSYVDLQRCMLFLPDSKTGRKPVRLNDEAVAVLTALPRLNSNLYVLPGRRDGIHLVNLQKPWRRIRTLAGLEGVRLHDLRHSFASIAAANGASLPLIGKLLGHSQPQTTARYTHLTDAAAQQLNSTVGSAIGAAMGRPHALV